MDNIYALEFCFHASIHRALFKDRSKAEAIVEQLRPLMGQDVYAYSRNDKSENIFTCKSEDGSEIVVVPSKLETVRILDYDNFNNLAVIEDVKTSKIQLDKKLTEKRAMLMLEAEFR